ncbi:MAG: hypothetical protein O7B99_13465, partial [Planctomycetota bacterium]|nr:hypothetical protein [Planctomycetota bacterium]
MPIRLAETLLSGCNLRLTGQSPGWVVGGGWGRTWLAALLFLAVLFAVFVLSFPERLYGDDVFLVWCIVRERVFTPHFLYMPLARLAARAGAHAGLDPFTTLRLMAALGTAVGGALLFLAARRRGADARIALVFALFVVTSPSTWFFATAAEIPGLHLGAVGLLAWTLAGLRPAASATRVLVAALAFGAAVGTHKSGVLLLPGAFAVYLFATAGRARGERMRDLAALALGGAISLGVMAASNLAAAGRILVTEDSPRRLFDLLRERFDPGDALVYLGTDAIVPSFALALLGCAALGSLLRRDRR